MGLPKGVCIVISYDTLSATWVGPALKACQRCQQTSAVPIMDGTCASVPGPTPTQREGSMRGVVFRGDRKLDVLKFDEARIWLHAIKNA